MRMVCQECHSEDVQINAWCDWSTAAQEWVPNLASDSPAAPFCQVCCQHTEVINMPDKQHGAANMSKRLDNLGWVEQAFRDNPSLTTLQNYLACAVVYEQDGTISTEELLDHIAAMCG